MKGAGFLRLSKRNARGIFGDVPNLVAFFDGVVRDRENIDQFFTVVFHRPALFSGWPHRYL